MIAGVVSQQPPVVSGLFRGFKQPEPHAQNTPPLALARGGYFGGKPFRGNNPGQQPPGTALALALHVASGLFQNFMPSPCRTPLPSWGKPASS